MNKLLFIAVMLELLVVAFIDFKTRKISNLWSIGNVIMACGIFFFLPQILAFDVQVLLLPGLLIVGGFFLFLMKIMGAGDSKYLASLMLLTPVEHHFLFLEKILLSTIVVGAILLVMRIIQHFSKMRAYFISRHYSGIRELIRSHFSYAPVILLAWALLGMSLWS